MTDDLNRELFDELWDTVDSIRKRPNHTVKVASREELVAHIARLQHDLDERINELVLRRMMQERAEFNERLRVQQRCVRTLQNQVSKLRIQLDAK